MVSPTADAEVVGPLKLVQADAAIAPVNVTEATTEEEWNGYVSGHPDATVDHLWQWRTVFKDVFRQECTYLLARRRDAVVGALPLVRFRSRLFGRSVVSVPYLNYGGVLASDDVAARALVAAATEVASRFGASHLELRHHSRQLPELPFRQHKVAMRLALPGTVDDLWKLIDRKVRNQVRKGQKEGLTTVTGGADLLADFYPVFAHNMRDLGTPVYPDDLFRTTLRLFAREAQVHVVRHGAVPVAAAVTIRFANRVIVPWASALREYRHLCSNMLLYWQMLESAIGNGVRTFDFGRSSVGGGTHQFKQQWGAAEVPLHWEYVLLNHTRLPDHGPQNAKFTAAVEGWKRLPLWLANRVGPAIVRNIP